MNMSPPSNIRCLNRTNSSPDQQQFGETIEKKSPSSFHSFDNYRHSFERVEKEKKTSTNLFQRLKHRWMKFFGEKPIERHRNKPTDTFAYDPDVDFHEESLTFLSQLLFTKLRENKIKHLSCDHLYLPCNHIENLARQCLIMSAEEPFGLQGAQIRIDLTLANGTNKTLPLIRINPKQKTIFQIEIDLHEDTKMFTLRRFLPEVKLFRNLKEKSPLYVSPRCTLIKNVFYKTAEPKRVMLDTTL